ncbi:ferredoxin family protein [Novosphingobium sp. KCTC 2891]|uniref:4Fe-4S dicluster domain-containing protein n=1 Tax=Novosphingobium sp. KCTC 2891 TaxID=2989730 RepID=UPI002222DC7C|nr:ferredoxin family protein [Novosphingobium sp. KCTC 2891]MCW1384083.1 ferredoxin family protein [Novosphingobium sp. KCTC 2891]
MIAALVEDRCTNCNACVRACPGFVFDAGADRPVIARIEACQTCYLCELACEADALWVNPDEASASAPSPAELARSGQLGQIRRDHGWNLPLDAGQLDDYRLLGPLLNEGADIAARRYASRG